MNKQKVLVSMLIAAGFISPMAHATNGMLMEGYGPIATGMGGASMAYDNGDAGMANNPATLGLMADGSRLDVAVGGLHPSVKTSVPGAEAKSGGDAYFMPAAGWVTKKNGIAYGIGVFAQGGMGTEYKGDSWLSQGTNGRAQRSEVGVGSLILPISYDISPDLTVAASADLVWSGMDLKMAMPASTMASMMGAGLITASGGATAAMGPFMGGAGNVGFFSFSDDSAFTGKAQATGFAGKLGMTYKVNKQLTMGATYHSKTSLDNMTASGAQLTMIDNAGALGPAGTEYTLNGKITVVDFQFPETYGIGAAYQVSDDLLVVADWKHIGWKEAMKKFRMKFSSSDMGGLEMDMTMPQDWKDQDVVQLGFAYKTTKELTLRAGANMASNPVPDDKVNPLFPATVKDHYTVGAGYAFDKVSSVNASLVYVPKVSVTSPAGYTIDHSQMNWQIMYSRAM